MEAFGGGVEAAVDAEGRGVGAAEGVGGEGVEKASLFEDLDNIPARGVEAGVVIERRSAAEEGRKAVERGSEP